MTFSDLLGVCRVRYPGVDALLMRHPQGADISYDDAVRANLGLGMETVGYALRITDDDHVVVLVWAFPCDMMHARRCQAAHAFGNLELAYGAEYRRDLILDLWSMRDQTLRCTWRGDKTDDDESDDQNTAAFVMITDVWSELARVASQAVPKPKSKRPKTRLGKAPIGFTVIADASADTSYVALRTWASENLKGKQRRVVELLIENGGRIQLADLARDPTIDWLTPYDDHWRGLSKAVNPKLKSQGWCVRRFDNEVRISQCTE